jgi:hypothetical protein
VLEDKFALTGLMAVELKAGFVRKQGLEKRLALDQLKVRDVPTVEMQLLIFSGFQKLSAGSTNEDNFTWEPIQSR